MFLFTDNLKKWLLHICWDQFFLPLLKDYSITFSSPCITVRVHVPICWYFGGVWNSSHICHSARVKVKESHNSMFKKCHIRIFEIKSFKCSSTKVNKNPLLTYCKLCGAFFQGQSPYSHAVRYEKNASVNRNGIVRLLQSNFRIIYSSVVVAYGYINDMKQSSR